MPEEKFVPAPDVGAVLVLARLEAERERRGNEWCEKHGVGAARRILDRAITLKAGARGQTAYLEAKASARTMLAIHCRNCGGCPMSRR